MIFVHMLAAAILVYFVYDAVREYLAAPGSVWQRVLAAGKSSATIVWARLVTIVTTGISSLVWVADVLNAPAVSAAITTYLKPSVVAAIMVAVALISEMARRRSL